MTIRTLIAALALAGIAPALAQAPAAPAPAPAKAAAPAAKPIVQATFATPEEAAAALAEAVRKADARRLLAVVGPKSRAWLFSGDAVEDRRDWERFLALYEEKHGFERDGDKAVLLLGRDEWPVPAPIVKRADRWAFDAEAGREETLNRRIGRNEISTIEALRAIVDAQREYAAADADGNGIHDYARKFASSPGKRDGLYWTAKPGEPDSPLGPLAAKALREGYGKQAKAGGAQAFHGYYYRMLTAQGPSAPGGAYDYLVGGRLFGGFAVVAYPARYGVSGVKSFLVNHDGEVFEKDLGHASAAQAGRMKRYDPGEGWKKAP